MIKLKSPEEISIMQEGGKRLKRITKQLIAQIKPGISTITIDEQAEKLILSHGGKPSFKSVKNYYWTTCLPINEQIVHTKPSKRTLVDGDILTVDIGMLYEGFHTDYAISFIVGKNTDNKKARFLDIGRCTLEKAILAAKSGKRIGNISQTIESEIGKNGYCVIKQLTGHGIGRQLHEDPYIPGFLEQPLDKTLLIKPGLVIAIEVIYSLGTHEIKMEKHDDWSIVTEDGSLAACFEHTIAVTEKNTFVLT